MRPISSTHSFGLVIPTLNEAGNIAVLLDQLQEALEPLQVPYQIVVVDDGSIDGTAEIVGNYARQDERVKLYVRRGERGLAGAVLYGWNHCQADLLGVIDGDLQHPPGLLPELVEAAATHVDLAIASRYTAEDGIRGWNPVRALISRLSILATLPLLRKNLRIKDPMSGFFVVRRECIEGLKFQAQGFKLLLEILVRGRIHSACEIPYHFGVRQTGKSKANLSVAYHYVQLLGRLSKDLVLRPGSQ